MTPVSSGPGSRLGLGLNVFSGFQSSGFIRFRGKEARLGVAIGDLGILAH